MNKPYCSPSPSLSLSLPHTHTLSLFHFFNFPNISVFKYIHPSLVLCNFLFLECATTTLHRQVLFPVFLHTLFSDQIRFHHIFSLKVETSFIDSQVHFHHAGSDPPSHERAHSSIKNRNLLLRRQIQCHMLGAHAVQAKNS